MNNPLKVETPLNWTFCLGLRALQFRGVPTRGESAYLFTPVW